MYMDIIVIQYSITICAHILIINIIIFKYFNNVLYYTVTNYCWNYNDTRQMQRY